MREQSAAASENNTWRPLQAIHPWVAEAQRTVRMGVALVGPRPEWDAMLDWVSAAETLGFDSFWAPDHPMLLPDQWITLAAAAARTTRLRLGTLVTCAGYRHPAVVARLASDVDRLSGGRVILGLGAGDLPAEFAQMGMPYPPIRERREILREAVQMIYGLWGETPLTVHGEHFSAEAAQVTPPAQQPYLPLLIGGGGDHTLRQVARFADVTNFGPQDVTGGVRTLAAVQRKLGQLRQDCEAVGRPYDAILRSHYVVLLVLAQTPAALAAKIARLPPSVLASFGASMVALTVREALTYYEALIEAGMRYFIAAMSAGDSETQRLLGSEVLPTLASR